MLPCARHSPGGQALVPLRPARAVPVQPPCRPIVGLGHRDCQRHARAGSHKCRQDARVHGPHRTHRPWLQDRRGTRGRG